MDGGERLGRSISFLDNEEEEEDDDEEEEEEEESGANQAQTTAQALAFNRKFTVIVRGQLNSGMCSDLDISSCFS